MRFLISEVPLHRDKMVPANSNDTAPENCEREAPLCIPSLVTPPDLPPFTVTLEFHAFTSASRNYRIPLIRGGAESDD